MRTAEAIIERVRRATKTHQHLELAVDKALGKLKPGQSLLVRAAATWHPYLREQWWPVNIGKNRVIIERPAVESYAPGQVVDVLGPVGRPFRFRRTLRNVLLVAFEAPPTPLLLTIEWLRLNDVSVTLVLLGEAARYDTTHLPAEIEIIHGDFDLNWPNRVMTVGWADQVFVVVAGDDELGRFRRIWEMFNTLRADIPKSYLFGVFTPLLPCGLGACHACMMRVDGGGTVLCCADGPALDLTQVAGL